MMDEEHRYKVYQHLRRKGVSMRQPSRPLPQLLGRLWPPCELSDAGSVEFSQVG